jgi:hypothetical protein
MERITAAMATFSVALDQNPDVRELWELDGCAQRVEFQDGPGGE